MSEECVVWVEIILLYLLLTRNMHERQSLNIRYIFLFSFDFMQFAMPDSRGIQPF